MSGETLPIVQGAGPGLEYTESSTIIESDSAHRVGSLVPSFITRPVLPMENRRLLA